MRTPGLDLPWDVVAKALEDIQGDNEDRGTWLCRKAAEYVRWHIRPRYEGVHTILEWLKGPDTPDRRIHLRKLVEGMGDKLEESAKERQGAITFAKKENGNWDLMHGAGSAVYVKLMQGQAPVQCDLLHKKVDAVLWFPFTGEDEIPRIGLEYYIQASGRNTSRRGDLVTAWNNASDRHLACAERFEKGMADLRRQIPENSRMIVSAVRFNGKKQNWQGGGVFAAPESPQVTQEEALEFLRQHRDELWCFPRVEHASMIEKAALEVRKPALSLLVPLDAKDLALCGGDALKLQNCLQNALKIVI